MIDTQLLDRLLAAVATRPKALASDLVTELRAEFPGIHVSVCSEDDIPARARPVAESKICGLYAVASGQHCLSLTDDLGTAAGLVVALRDEDEA